MPNLTLCVAELQLFQPLTYSLSLRLHSGATEDAYTFEPVYRDAGSAHQVLSFSRTSGKASVGRTRGQYLMALD